MGSSMLTAVYGVYVRLIERGETCCLFFKRFRSGSGSSAAGDGKKDRVGMEENVSQPASATGGAGATASSPSSATASSSAASTNQSGSERRGDTVWYVDHHFTAEPPAPRPGEKGELSSLSLLTAAGLQHTVLAALRQTDPTTTATTAATATGAADANSGVKASDTLERIAAHHDITPSELQKVNKMTSRMVFAGQILYIPDPDYVPSDPPTPEPSSPPVSPTMDPRPKLDVPIVKMADKPPEKVPGHAMKIPSPPSSASILPSPHPLSEEEARKLDEECHERFLKLCAKYITEGMGMVTGTLLVTPNAIMFDPDMRDLLVKENGPDGYGVVIYFETILSAALYHDLSAMRYHTRTSSEREVMERPAIYHADLRPRSASTSSIRTNSSATLATQGVTTSHSASGLSPFFSASGENTQNSPGRQGKLESSPLAAGGEESSTDAVDEGAGKRDSGEIRFVGSDVARSVRGDEGGMVMVEGAQTGETSTDDVFTFDAASQEGATASATSPLITFDLSTVPQLGTGSGEKIEESSQVSERVQSDDTVSDGFATSQPESKETFTRETPALAAGEVSLPGGVNVDLLSFDSYAPKEQTVASEKDGTDQTGTLSMDLEGLMIGEATPTSQDNGDNLVSTAAEGDAENLSIPVQESAGALRSEDASAPALVSTDEPTLDSGAEVPGDVSACAPRDTGTFSTEGKSSDDRQEKGAEEAGGVETESGTQEGEEMRIGNIVYLPVEESSSGEMIVRGSSDDLIPVAPTQEATELNLDDEDGSARDAVDGAGSGSRPPSGSFSPLRSSAQHLSNLVNYATGFFRNTADDRKDVPDMPKGQGSAGTEPEGARRRWASEKSGRGKATLRNAVGVDERPDLFRDINSLIPHLPEDDDRQPPIYLHLHVDEARCDRLVAATALRESYTEHQITKPHYWFSIPRSKVDNLYAFFIQWRPEVYGDEDIDPEDQGFVVVKETDVQGAEAPLNIVEDFFGSTAASFKKDWELISREEIRRRQPSIDTEPVTMPEMDHDSSILTESQLADSLPPRTIGYRWALAYSTALNGISLQTLYRCVAQFDSPILLVVQDTEGHIFGAYASHPLRYSDHFYGNGTSQLWTFKDGFKVFKWTGDNTFFIKGDRNSLSFGSGS
ncbi:hypothetical protein BaRGS_00032869, partial [Batillaria attramentaria]